VCFSWAFTSHSGDVRQLEHNDFFAPQARPAGQPLITVSNHVAAMDDPLLLAALTPFRSVFETGGMRWSLCASDRCFKNSLMSAFFRAGQVCAKQLGGSVLGGLELLYLRVLYGCHEQRPDRMALPISQLFFVNAAAREDSSYSPRCCLHQHSRAAHAAMLM